MATEQAKAPAPAQPQEHVYSHPPPGMIPYPHFSPASFPPPPPPGTYPHPAPFFTYAAGPHDPAHPDPAGAAPPPYVYPYAPGMMYAYPPPPPAQGYTAPPASAPAPPASPTQRAKRKQVKMACTNCAAACKRCDESRPCERCVKYGIATTCVDGTRKERKKGIKRGPYKRKNKNTIVESASFTGPDGDAEWQPAGAPPQTNGTNPTSPASTPNIAPAAPMQAIHPAFTVPPEGYYPVFYPNGFPAPHAPVPHEGDAVNGHPPPVMPFFVPAGFPPFSAYPPPPHPMYAAPPAVHPQATVNPSATAPGSPKKGSDGSTEAQVNGATVNGKKRPRSSAGKAGDAKAKRNKAREAKSKADGDSTVAENGTGVGDHGDGAAGEEDQTEEVVSDDAAESGN
ncbi:hypothetical protein HGRIS_011820 [Hohenbuehelia grisea]|uniref:Transcription activator of gluconeogenesis ERT1 n=1 Tax=Hohenbuehelia grisea TaxID=104357 RepID=A0ABR3JXC8_9AGAR